MAGDLHVGVLALQGDFEAHKALLESLGARVSLVRRPAQLAPLSGLVLPGGESSTLLKLMADDLEWGPRLRAFANAGRAVLGTCAGLILVAREVSPPQTSFGLIDAAVERNSYGRQLDSFVASGAWVDGRPLEMVFIRAPRILSVGPAVSVLAEHAGDPVLEQSGAIIAASFHPELSEQPAAVHRLFLEHAAAATPPRPVAQP